MGGDCKVSLFALFNVLSQKSVMHKFPTVRFDFAEVKTAAEVLFVVNPLNFKCVEEIEDFIVQISMNSFLRDENNRPVITGTAGWYVTFFPIEDEHYAYQAQVTLMPHTMKEFIKKVTRNVEVLMQLSLT